MSSGTSVLLRGLAAGVLGFIVLAGGSAPPSAYDTSSNSRVIRDSRNGYAPRYRLRGRRPSAGAREYWRGYDAGDYDGFSAGHVDGFRAYRYDTGYGPRLSRFSRHFREGYRDGYRDGYKLGFELGKNERLSRRRWYSTSR